MSTAEHTQFLDHRVVDEAGDTVGRVTDVVFDRETGEPRYAVVKTGVIGRGHYVPLDRIYKSEDGDLVVPWTKDAVSHAPTASKDHVLTDDDEAALAEHYG
jgi:sporulation protein YlmC with PRC-barrel domain